MNSPTDAVVRRKYFLVLSALIAAFLFVQSSLEMIFAFRENKLRIAEVQGRQFAGCAPALDRKETPPRLGGGAGVQLGF